MVASFEVSPTEILSPKKKDWFSIGILPDSIEIRNTLQDELQKGTTFSADTGDVISTPNELFLFLVDKRQAFKSSSEEYLLSNIQIKLEGQDFKISWMDPLSSKTHKEAVLKKQGVKEEPVDPVDFEALEAESDQILDSLEKDLREKKITLQVFDSEKELTQLRKSDASNFRTRLTQFAPSLNGHTPRIIIQSIKHSVPAYHAWIYSENGIGPKLEAEIYLIEEPYTTPPPPEKLAEDVKTNTFRDAVEKAMSFLEPEFVDSTDDFLIESKVGDVLVENTALALHGVENFHSNFTKKIDAALHEIRVASEEAAEIEDEHARELFFKKMSDRAKSMNRSFYDSPIYGTLVDVQRSNEYGFETLPENSPDSENDVVHMVPYFTFIYEKDGQEIRVDNQQVPGTEVILRRQRSTAAAIPEPPHLPEEFRSPAVNTTTEEGLVDDDPDEILRKKLEGVPLTGAFRGRPLDDEEIAEVEAAILREQQEEEQPEIETAPEPINPYEGYLPLGDFENNLNGKFGEDWFTIQTSGQKKPQLIDVSDFINSLEKYEKVLPGGSVLGIEQHGERDEDFSIKLLVKASPESEWETVDVVNFETIDQEKAEVIREPLQIEASWWQWNFAMRNSESWQKLSSRRKSDIHDSKLPKDFPSVMKCEITFDLEIDAWVVIHNGKNYVAKHSTDAPKWIGDLLTEIEAGNIDLAELSENFEDHQDTWKPVTSEIIDAFAHGGLNFLITFPDGNTQYLFGLKSDIVLAQIHEVLSNPNVASEKELEGLQYDERSNEDQGLVVRKGENVWVIEALSQDDVSDRQKRILDLKHNGKLKNYMLEVLHERLVRFSHQGKLNFDNLRTTIDQLQQAYSFDVLTDLGANAELTQLWDVPLLMGSDGKMPLSSAQLRIEIEEFFKKNIVDCFKSIMGNEIAQIIQTEMIQHLDDKERKEVLIARQLDKDKDGFRWNLAKRRAEIQELEQKRTHSIQNVETIIKALIQAFQGSDNWLKRLDIVMRVMKNKDNPRVSPEELELGLQILAKQELVREAEARAGSQSSYSRATVPSISNEAVQQRVLAMKQDRKKYEKITQIQAEDNIQDQMRQIAMPFVKQFETMLVQAMPNPSERDIFTPIALDVVKARLGNVEEKVKHFSEAQSQAMKLEVKNDELEDEDEDEEDEEEEVELDEIMEDAMAIVRQHRKAEKKDKKTFGDELNDLIIENLELFEKSKELNSNFKSDDNDDKKIVKIKTRLFDMYDKGEWEYEAEDEEEDNEELTEAQKAQIRAYAEDEKKSRETQVVPKVSLEQDMERIAIQIQLEQFQQDIEDAGEDEEAQLEAVSELVELIRDNLSFFLNKHQLKDSPDSVKLIAQKYIHSAFEAKKS